MGWALERAGGRSAGGQEASPAIEALRSGQPGPRALLRAVSASGWTERAIDLSTPSRRGRLLSRAAALALSDPSEHNMEHVLTLRANVGPGAPSAWTRLEAWDHLEAVLTGRALPGEACPTLAIPAFQAARGPAWGAGPCSPPVGGVEGPLREVEKPG